jgi:hypothetical protein
MRHTVATSRERSDASHTETDGGVWTLRRAPRSLSISVSRVITHCRGYGISPAVLAAKCITYPQPLQMTWTIGTIGTIEPPSIGAPSGDTPGIATNSSPTIQLFPPQAWQSGRTPEAWR